MKRECVAKMKSTEDSSEGSFMLEYLLVEEETAVENGFGICTYGIEVVKKSRRGIECQAAPSISCEKSMVLQFIKHIALHEVTPVTLLDVVYDMLCDENNFEFTESRICLYNRKKTLNAAVV